jgi:putative glutamine transport system substrate-binding protein
MTTLFASRSFGAVCAALLLLAPVLARAESATLGHIRQRDLLVIGSKQSFPVFNIKDPATGRNEGFFADLSRLLAKQLLGDENKVTFVVTTDENRFPKLAAGEVDLLIDTIPVNDEKLKVADFSDETFVSGSALLVKQGSSIHTLADIHAGTRVAFVTANEDIALIRAKAPAATYLEFAASNDALAALKDGRADVFTQVVTHLYRAASQDAHYTLVGRFTTKPYHIFLPKGDAELQAYLNKFLQSLRTSGEYDRLYAKWFGPYGGATVR